MPATNPLDFSSAASAATALKKVKQLMIRAGQAVVATEFIDKPKRTNGITYREAFLTLASGQAVTLRVTAAGDIYQVLLNNSVVPIKAHDDTAKAVAEIAALAEKNQAAFQKAQARKAIALPPGMTTPAPKMASVLTQRVAQLDTQIAERRATVAGLQAQLGALTDSVVGESLPAMSLAVAYIDARDLVGARSEMLDSAATEGAVAVLRIALDMMETNYPINLKAGNLEQAALEQRNAESYRVAIGMLDSAAAVLGDAGLAELVNIAVISAAEGSDIKDQAALAVLLALGLVETSDGLYMVTGKGNSALDDAGYDVYGEPYAANAD